jgi:outer membrane immunogenic protein
MRRHLIASLTSAGLSAGLIVAASAADLPRPAATPVYVKAQPRASSAWGGFYVGANAGFIDATGRATTDATVLSSPDEPNVSTPLAAAATNQFNVGHGGFLGGAQFGYNYVLTPSFLVGVETDLQGSSLRRTSNRSNSALTDLFNGDTGDPDPNTANWVTGTSVSNRLDYLGTLRARLGVTATPNVLLYGTGGLAYGGVHSTTSMSIAANKVDDGTPVFGVPPTSTGGSFSGTRTGWTAGAGVEWMFLPGWTTKLEYLHYDLGTVTYPTGGYSINVNNTNLAGDGIAAIRTSTTTQFRGDIVRVGVNYMFH